MSLFTEDQSVKFEDLVGEGKKYKDTEAVAKAIAEKDRFIEQLKAEKQEVLRDLNKPPVIDRSQEILDRLEKLATTQPVTQSRPDPEPERTVTSLTEDDVLRLMQRQAAEAKARANIEAAKAELTKKFGNQTSQVLKNLQDTMGVSAQFLDNLAAQSPAAFLKLLEGQKSESVFTPPESSKGTSFQPTAAGPKPRSWYIGLKQSDKKQYDSPAVQNQMYKDSMALGEAFFDVPD